MSFRFKHNETFEVAFRRITKQQIAKAHKHLAFDDDVAVSIHEARKCLKRLRALLRIYRPALGNTTFARENARYRNIGRLLSASRDRHVTLETISFLLAETDDGPKGAKSKSVRNGLARLHKIVTDTLVSDACDVSEIRAGENVRRRAIASLDVAQQEQGGVRLKAPSFKSVCGGLKHTYRKGVRAFRAARRHDESELLHELRKSAQAHWRHMVLFKDVWPAYFGFRIEAAKEISEVIGHHHDLDLVRCYLQGLPPSQLDRKLVRAVGQDIERRQLMLRDVALDKAAMLFADDPGDFARQVQRYWKTWCTKGRERGRARKPKNAKKKSRSNRATAISGVLPAADAPRHKTQYDA